MPSFVQFIKSGDTGKTGIFEVRGNSSSAPLLGEIRWYAPWRRYCFFPWDDVLFDASCLKEIAVEIDGLMAERKK